MTRQRKRQRRGEDLDEALVNLTPLIDVVFVVLIMFILIAPMLELDHVVLADGSEQKRQTVSQTNERMIDIHVYSDNSIWIDKHQISQGQISEVLKLLWQRFPKSQVRLFHDREAQFGTYQTVKNAVDTAGFTSMDVILKPV